MIIAQGTVHHTQFLIDDNILRGGYDFRDGDEVNFEVNGTYSTELFQQRAIDIIENHPEDEPLFLYVPFQSVHDPIEVPDEYVDNFEYIDNEKRKKYLGMILAMDEAVGNIIKSLEVFAFFSTHEHSRSFCRETICLKIQWQFGFLIMGVQQIIQEVHMLLLLQICLIT